MRSVRQADGGFLAALAHDARRRVDGGYYDVNWQTKRRKLSLREALGRKGNFPVIAEIKFRSPSEGRITDQTGAVEIARAYQRGGAAAVSVLTEPDNFGGSLGNLAAVADTVTVPVMMKDVIVDRAQLEAGARSGADAVLLICAVFASGLAGCPIEEMTEHAHRLGLEVVAEVHHRQELDDAFRGGAEIVGVNNRDLRTLSVSLMTSKSLLRSAPKVKPVICESGISTRADVELMRSLGASGVLVGTALMKSDNPEGALKELTGAARE